MQEVGPYVWEERWQREEVAWSEDQEEVSPAHNIYTTILNIYTLSTNIYTISTLGQLPHEEDVPSPA